MFCLKKLISIAISMYVFQNFVSKKSSHSILEAMQPEFCAKLAKNSLSQIASATLQSVLSNDVTSRINHSIAEIKACELNDFTQAVVESLYKVKCSIIYLIIGTEIQWIIPQKEELSFL